MRELADYFAVDVPQLSDGRPGFYRARWAVLACRTLPQ